MKCIVAACRNYTSNRRRNVSFHKFPKNETQKNLWIKSIRLEDLKLIPNMVVCSDHFPKNALIKCCGRTILTSNAVPKLEICGIRMDRSTITKPDTNLFDEPQIRSVSPSNELAVSSFSRGNSCSGEPHATCQDLEKRTTHKRSLLVDGSNEIGFAETSSESAVSSNWPGNSYPEETQCSATMNYPHQATTSENEFEIKEEINEDFNDGVKCGEVFFLQTEQIVLICGFCEKSFGDLNEFGIHIQENHISKSHAIEIFEQIEEHEPLKFEFVEEILTDYEAIPDDEPQAEVVTTFPFESVSINAERPKRPQNKKKKNPDLYCTICQIQYENKVRFEIHNEKKHNILRACEFCNKPFDSLEERSQHERTHVGDSPYTCLICSTGFKQKFSRDKHIEYVHEGIKRHKCSICDRSFATRTILRAHETVHASVSGQHSCEFCGRQFAHESVMKVHVKRHKGEKTFQCEECGERFITRTILNNHQKRHGEMNVECEICGKKFYTTGSLRKHSEVHSARLYACSICGNAFKAKKTLRIHMELHSDVKKYACDICDMEFAQSIGLYTHKKKYHGSIRKESV